MIRENLSEIKRETGGKLLFMVKADAYGHGAMEVARAAESVADMFGVATVAEGEELREGGIKKDILVSVADPDELESAAKLNLIVALTNCAELKAIERMRLKGARALPLRMHLKLDTGMHRLGFETDELDCVLKLAKNLGIEIEGIYSHLRRVNDAQLDSFRSACAITDKYFPDAIKHLASSGALYREDMRFDMVRVGLNGYKNAEWVVSEVLNSRYVRKGEYLGYGDFLLDHDANAAIVFGGYADGVARENPSDVIIRGKACKPLGKVCMDMFAVETEGFFASAGEPVLLQGGGIGVSAAAAQRRTIDYTVLTGWRGRTQRIYLNGQERSSENCEGEGK